MAVLITVLLSNIMCAVVACQYCNMRHCIEDGGCSAPASATFVYAIPFLIGIAASSLIAVLCYRKTRNNVA